MTLIFNSKLTHRKGDDVTRITKLWPKISFQLSNFKYSNTGLFFLFLFHESLSRSKSPHAFCIRITVRNLKNSVRFGTGELLRAVRDDDCERSRVRSFPRASVNAGRHLYRKLPSTETQLQYTLLFTLESLTKACKFYG